MGKIKVLYIAGSGRSGSTLLNNLLGQIEGFFSAGELCYVWSRGFIHDRLCSCGVPFAECVVWGAVVERAFGGADGVDAGEMHRVQQASTRLRHLPLMVAYQGRRVLESRWKGTFRDNLEKVYGTISDVTGSRIIVDGSKLPLYGYALDAVPAIELYVLHLVRDPRAVAYSWLRKKPKPMAGGFSLMPQRHPVRSSLEWDVYNAATEMLFSRSATRYLLLRYEDLMRWPQESVRRVLKLVDEEEASLPFVSERGIQLSANHNIGGNPTRFQTGVVELRPDREWVVSMKSRDHATVTSLTFPLLKRYGYPVSLGDGSLFAT